jgi:hypothetical protein
MRKSPRSAAVYRPRERVVVIDILKQQMLDLQALRKEVAEAERALRTERIRNRLRERLHRTHAPQTD